MNCLALVFTTKRDPAQNVFCFREWDTFRGSNHWVFVKGLRRYIQFIEDEQHQVNDRNRRFTKNAALETAKRITHYLQRLVFLLMILATSDFPNIFGRLNRLIPAELKITNKMLLKYSKTHSKINQKKTKNQ